MTDESFVDGIKESGDGENAGTDMILREGRSEFTPVSAEGAFVVVIKVVGDVVSEPNADGISVSACIPLDDGTDVVGPTFTLEGPTVLVEVAEGDGLTLVDSAGLPLFVGTGLIVLPLMVGIFVFDEGTLVFAADAGRMVPIAPVGTNVVRPLVGVGVVFNGVGTGVIGVGMGETFITEVGTNVKSNVTREGPNVLSVSCVGTNVLLAVGALVVEFKLPVGAAVRFPAPVGLSVTVVVGEDLVITDRKVGRIEGLGDTVVLLLFLEDFFFEDPFPEDSFSDFFFDDFFFEDFFFEDFFFLDFFFLLLFFVLDFVGVDLLDEK